MYAFTCQFPEWPDHEIIASVRRNLYKYFTNSLNRVDSCHACAYCCGSKGRQFTTIHTHGNVLVPHRLKIHHCRIGDRLPTARRGLRQVRGHRGMHNPSSLRTTSRKKKQIPPSSE